MSIEVDGVAVTETSRASGATRVRPGGWNVSTLDPDVWVGDGTVEGAREMVERGLPSLPH